MSYSVKYPVGTTVSPSLTQTRYEIGVITGKHRDITAVLADNTGHDGLGFDSTAGGPDDNWYVGNIFDADDRYIDTIAIGGAIDADHASYTAKKQLAIIGGHYCKMLQKPAPQVTSAEPQLWSITAINRLLNNPSQDKYYLPVITAAELEAESARLTFDSVQWSDNDELISHDGKDAKLYFELTRLDEKGELTTQFDALDEMKALVLEGVETELSFDALIETKSRLPQLKTKLQAALSNASTKDLYVESVIESEPFKRGGVLNIAFIFSLSDGQDLSIWFHSPNDSDVKKLLPNDSLVSWKWMLNKKDVTAVLQPANSGNGVQLSSIAKRMMRIANQNSQAFKRSKTRAAKQAQEIADLESSVAAYDAEIVALDAEILELNQKISAAMSPPVATEQPIDPAVADEPEVTPNAANSNTGPAATDNWWDNSPDNVSVYLIGRSRKHSFVKITNVDGVFEVEIAHNKMMKYTKGDLDKIKAYIEKTTQNDAGKVPALKLVSGADVLNGADLPAGSAQEWEEDAPAVTPAATAADKPSDENDPDRLTDEEFLLSEFMKRSTSKSYFLDFNQNDVELNEDDVYEIFRGYLAGKTIRYASTLFKVMDAVKAWDMNAKVADFNGTLNQLSMFDSLNSSSMPVYGVTVQISNDDYTAIIRASIDKDGVCEILLDESGKNVFETIEFNTANNVAKYKKAIDAAMGKQESLNAVKLKAAEAETEKTEAAMTTDPVVDPVVDPVADPVVDPAAGASKDDDLIKEIRVLNEVINSENFDHTTFDSSRIVEMLSETTDDKVIDLIGELSSNLRSKMVAISLAAMAAM